MSNANIHYQLGFHLTSVPGSTLVINRAPGAWSPRASLEGWSLERKIYYKKRLMLASVWQDYHRDLLPRSL